MTEEKYPAITVGVVTHDKRLEAFEKLLGFMQRAVEHYGGQCEFLVANNSGSDFHQQLESAIEKSDLKSACRCRVVDSSANNIAVGRNCVIDNAAFDWIAFIDDDEYPTTNWLTELCHVMVKRNVYLVAGPILPVYEANTSRWIQTVDVHNTKGKRTGDKLAFAAAGNFLAFSPSLGEVRFNENYGKTGGEDTEFFLRLTTGPSALDMVWAEKAVVHEDIPASKSTARYMFSRFLSQGSNYKRILAEAGTLGNPILFHLKAALVAVGSLVIAAPLVLIRHQSAGDWLKRGVSNAGKLYSPSGQLY